MMVDEEGKVPGHPTQDSPEKRVFTPHPPGLSNSSLDIHISNILAIVHLSLQHNTVSHINANMFQRFSLNPLF